MSSATSKYSVGGDPAVLLPIREASAEEEEEGEEAADAKDANL